MNNFKYFLKKHKAIIIVSLCLALSLGIVGYTAFKKIELEKQFQQQTIEGKDANEKIIAMTNTIGEMQAKEVEISKDMLKLQSEVDVSKSDIVAFAKQAAACNVIKKRLHIKE